MSLFYDDKSRASDPGNRCKMRLRHAMLPAWQAGIIQVAAVYMIQ